jgi:serine/threonine protein kinase
MLGTVLFKKYSVDSQARSSDWFDQFVATESSSGKKFAVLAFHAALGSAEQVAPRLAETAKILAALPADLHPAWLKTGKSDERAVIVCQAAEGKTLADRIAGSGGLPEPEIIELAYRLGKYLEALHSSDLLQGIFSPQELLFPGEGGAPLVTAPALASLLDLPKLLKSGALPERPYYAPELTVGKSVDARSDLYSLGAILFEALTGKPVPKPEISPEKTTIVTWLPSRLRRDISPALDELAATCLHPEPAKRYPSLAAFLSALEDLRPQAEESPSVIAMEDSLVGQTLGAYRLVERLGQGGMATVYKAYEPALNRYVAIKVLPQFFANDPSFAVRFRREAKAVARLSHPNIVPIYSYGESGGVTYIAMQFVEGGTLKHERGEKMDCATALRLLLPITRALDYAHKRGIVHRDVKPSNVLLGEEGWPLLADFGLAKMAEGSSEKLTGTGVGMGTPMYMSPEQGQGVNVDHRSDIYSLGIMLYEFVTGDVPFRADTPMAIVIKHMTAPMPMPRSVDPSIPEAVEALILKATAKDSADRYQSAADLADAMEAILLGAPAPASTANKAEGPRAGGQPIETTPAPGPAAARQRPARARKPLRRILFGVLGLLGFCLLAVILMGVFDVCPPQGPWPQPPWCEGSPFQFSFGGAPTAALEPTATFAVPTGGYDPFGRILLQDDFDGPMLPKWQFSCDPYTTPWILEEIDGRTVFHSQPPSQASAQSCAEIRDTDWQDYTIEYSFKFHQPDQFGIHYYNLAGRITNCPPNVQSLQEYGIAIQNTGIQLYKGTCVPAGQRQLTEVVRPIDSDSWHRLQLMLLGNNIQVWLDGEQWLDYTDESDAIIKGGDLWLTTRDSNEVLFDGLKVFEAIPSDSVQTADDRAQEFAEPIRAQIESLPPDFSDDFSDSDRTRTLWYVPPGITIDRGAAVMAADGDHAYVGLDLPLFSGDFALEFEFTPRSIPSEVWVGVAFRAEGDHYNHFTVSIWDAPESGVVFGKNEPGVLAEAETRLTGMGQKTKALVIARGDQAALYLNDQAILFGDDLWERGGGVVLGITSVSGESVVEFDNVRFWDLNNLQE